MKKNKSERKHYCSLAPWLKERLRLDIIFSKKTNAQLSREYYISEQLVYYYRARWTRRKS